MRTHRPHLVSALITFLGVIVLLIATTVALAVAIPDEPSRVTIRYPAFDVYGALELHDGYDTREPDKPCQGGLGYNDMRAGAQVVITDASDDVVALGELGKGKIGRSNTGYNVCLFEFHVKDVPGRHETYGVEISKRGVVHFAKHEMRGGIVLTLSAE